MKKYLVRSIGENKGKPRIFLDSLLLSVAGFLPGKTYNRTVSQEGQRITLTVCPNGTHVVCRKEKAGTEIPVIDINSAKALAPFEGMQAVRVVVMDNQILILALASEVNRKERLQRLQKNLDAGTVTTAGISFGGGVLDHAAHAGLHDAGIHANLAFANEIDADLLEHASTHNDIWRKDTIGLAAPMQELVQDAAAMQRLPQVDVLCAGIPCSGASRAGKAKRGLDMMEAHPQVGHLVASALMVINRIQPAVVVIENVELYSDSASAHILRNHLRDSGYVVRETVLDASEFGSLEARVRWFMVAASAGIDIDLQDLAPKLKPVRTMAEILDPIGPDAHDWRTFDYLKAKEVRDAAKGNVFAMQTVSQDSTSCGTLRKGYAKGGSTDPLLKHPTDPDLLRQFTVAEHARIKDVPEQLVADLSKVDGHALLGQGVAYKPVRALFRRIGEGITNWHRQLAAQTSTQRTLGYDLQLATG
ncbi:DNA cytosine methyltransferase [Curvibacter sp. APW13]|uniref:DNA cytosine methyltransferase n=1 Tax=Curvibacter sp. APW13 TaxID=3077236 RepID=UPI0028DE2ED7|nr:DNA cytosine methyltransferase [Curvibacter sp. APW13]MDT8992760.1 DNA cytosine methyltransferase [Curvibacter sp. APW13]